MKRYSKANLPATIDDAVNERLEMLGGDKRLDFLFRNRVLRHTVKKSCELSNISESYGYQILKRFRTQRSFQNEIKKAIDLAPDTYKDSCKLLLPTILDTELKAVQAMADDPSLAVKHPQLLKQMKQAAGIDFAEKPQVVGQIINIDSLNLMQTLVGNDVADQKAIDVTPDPDE